ncbi:MAG: cytochrome-like protein [Ramlibacter sp.]|nr:cytochrome-like protein [Ramlibacter sp.]
MNKLLNTLFALSVACATSLALAQAPAATAPAATSAPAAAAPAPAPAAPAAKPAGPKSLEAKTAMCYGCHNIVGYQASFPEVYKVPKLGGQNAAYIAAALKAYQAGDRKHPTMRAIATPLTDQDITDIASFYEKQGRAAQPAEKASREPDAQVTALFAKSACVSCHGANFSKPIAPNYPKIAGQHADYLFVALKSYKTENNPAVGRSNGVMAAVAKQFTNAELKVLAKYVASLDGELQTLPEPKFHH